MKLMHYQSIFECLCQNFYVDDFQKSIKNVDSTKELVKDVMQMCKADGFYLEKVISNNKEFLLRIS